MLPLWIALIASAPMSLEWVPVPQLEKFSAFRPCSTSRVTSYETGATWLYQGHAVELLWQSRQELCLSR